jgi:flavodoxin
MKALVVYDSLYENTAKVAEAIGDALRAGADVDIIRASDATPAQLAGLSLLIVGCPTQRFTATPATTQFLKSIPKGALAGVKVAAFDTRFPQSKIDEIGILAFFVRIFGYAAEPIAARLKRKGGELAAPPAWFYVGDMKGPLLEGELERAAEWARDIAGRL